MKLIITAILLCMIACDEPAMIPSEIIPLVSKFEREGKKRGISVSVDVDIFLGKYKTSFYDGNKRAIFIDTTSENYRLTKEELIMHELGHAVLKREHDFSKLQNLCAKSVMGNFSNRIYSGWSSPETSYREKYYYDELFNDSTTPPTWSIPHN